jgi:hypothetical protein
MAPGVLHLGIQPMLLSSRLSFSSKLLYAISMENSEKNISVKK